MRVINTGKPAFQRREATRFLLFDFSFIGTGFIHTTSIPIFVFVCCRTLCWIFSREGEKEREELSARERAGRK
jgi:hypothetical protein